MTNAIQESIKKVYSSDAYDYYIGENNKGKKFYCLVPAGSYPPAGGYYNPEYACKIKNAPNFFN